MITEEQRKSVAEEALSWVGTPYYPKAAIKGTGVDCAWFVLEVLKRCGVISEYVPPNYDVQWALHQHEEKYLEEVAKFGIEISESEAGLGDVVMFRQGNTFSHSAIITKPWPDEIVHAVWRLGVVRTHGATDALVQGRSRKFFTAR